MNQADLSYIAKRGWLLLFGSTLVGALLGFIGELQSSPVYQSTARTSVTAGPAEGSVDAIYQVTQAIRVTMPQYVSLARSDRVAQMAVSTSGIPITAITSFSVITAPDSTVMDWSMTSGDPVIVQQALDETVHKFAEVVSAESPRANGQPVTSVSVDAAASPAERHATLTRPLAVALGAAAGFLGALIMVFVKLRIEQRTRDAETVEQTLAIPVVGELTRERFSEQRCWEYVSSFIASSACPGTILLVGDSARPSGADGHMLAETLESFTGSRDYSVQLGKLGEQETTRCLRTAHTVVLHLRQGEDHLGSLRSHIRSIRAICSGSVCAVLDGRVDNQLTDFLRVGVPRDHARSR